MAFKQNHSDFTQVLEHDQEGPETKKVSIYGWDSDNLQKTKVGVDSGGNVLIKVQEVVPTDPTQNNSSLVINLDADHDLESVDEVIDGTTFRTTITKDNEFRLLVSEAVQI